ncbi:MAG: transcription elongation factor GreA [Bacteroidales bacterium]|jgi:transcription elongation factor GreA|nr:transcription elongation factor GreA [Bacteroidales bacterium]
MSNINYYTKEGLENLKKELQQLISVERPNISQQIAEARDKGDLSENAEYDAAKEAQGLLELKISKLQELVASARIIDESKIDTSKVLLFSKVTIKNLKNNAVMTYTVVPETEADLKANKISVSSPIASSMLGKKKKEKFEVKAPAGLLSFEIIDIQRD